MHDIQQTLHNMTRRRFLGQASSACLVLASGASRAESKKGDFVTKLVDVLSIPNGGRPDYVQDLPLALPSLDTAQASTHPEGVLMFRGNPSHTQYGVGPAPSDFSVRWSYRMKDFHTRLRGRRITWKGTGWTGQAVAVGDFIYVGSVGRGLYAFEANTGRLRWRTEGGRMFKSSPCYYKGHLYIGNTDNLFRCVDASTGVVKWALDMGADCDSSPCVVNNRLYVGGESGHARCIDPDSGAVLWESYLGATGPGTPPGSNGCEASPAVQGDELFIANYDGTLFCLDSNTGLTKWSASTLDDTDASPVVTERFVYIASENKSSHVFCFDRHNAGKEVWRFSKNTYGFWSTPAIAGNDLFIGGQDDRLYALDRHTGALRWTFKADAAIWSSPAVSGDAIVFGSYDHYLYSIDRNSGSLITKIKLDGRCISTPIIYRKCIYVGTATGTFYCIGAAS
ncbi:MAG: PQQ-binding-like beta-propeller repeat protein [Bradymonadia bacterium]